MSEAKEAITWWDNDGSDFVANTIAADLTTMFERVAIHSYKAGAIGSDGVLKHTIALNVFKQYIKIWGKIEDSPTFEDWLLSKMDKAGIGSIS